MMDELKYLKLSCIATLMLLAVFVTSCDKSKVVGEYYLGDLIYSNPYQGTEILVYSSSDGKELSFECLGRSKTTYESQVSINSNDYYIAESDYCSFIDSTNNYRIGILLETSEHSQPELGIGLSNYLLSKGSKYTSNSRFNLPLEENNLKEGQEYYDSIAINGKFYYHVFSDPCELYFPSGNSSDTNQYLSTLYYNTVQGLIKLNFSDGNTWELKEIVK